jgi:glucose/arabinose dehydrogenase
MRRLLFAVFIAALAACDSKGDGSSHDGFRDKPPAPAAAPAELPKLRMLDAFPRLEFDKPLWLTTPPDGTKRLFVVEQDGRVSWFHAEPAPSKATLFLDISAKAFKGHNEEGLLALAFHPKYKENGYFYVWYTRNKPRRHVLSRFKVSASDPGKADPASETVFIEIEKPWGNHNGATVLFGPDGFLYFSVGDGGAAGDPQKNGQNLGSWLAKVHRIDVDHEDGKKPYSIPKDNPFLETAGAKPETWAYGLRNIWRMSFDRQTGDLWGGDVGQDKYEEVDLIVKGGNYGWRVREGLHGFTSETPKSPPLDPVIEYGRKDGSSITGGYVYRGKAMKDLVGAYIYADYVTGTIWALRHDGKQVTAWKEVLRQPKNIASFGEDWDGELYVTCFDGKIYRLATE